MTTAPDRDPQAIWVLDALHRNGAVRLTLQIAERLSGTGSRLAVVQRLEPGREVPMPPGLRVGSLVGGSGRLRFRMGTATVRLARWARRTDVIVNCSEIGMGLLISTVAGRLTGKPLVVAVHADLDTALREWLPARLHRLFYWLHRHVDGAICVSPALADPLVRNGLPASRIRVVQNGIDVAAVQATAAAPVDPEPPAGPVVVATGRVAHQKGYDVLVRAHAKIVTDTPHRLRIHNDGPELDRIRSLGDELGVAGSIDFVDPRISVLPYVVRADAFCLPSRHEGLPLALLEAVAVGAPCIAADCSDGVRAVLDDGRVGDLVPVEDVDALAEALRNHLRDPAPLRAKAARGPAHALTFDIEVMVREWVQALRELTVTRH